MILEKMVVFVDPVKILNEYDSNLLYDNTDCYEKVWKNIKLNHNIDTNMKAKDIHLFNGKVLTLQTTNPLPEVIPEQITTESGFIIGIEFKDLKKLNPDITQEDLEDAFIINCVHFGGGMDEDHEAEYIDGYLTFENVNYNSSDENSKRNVSYEVTWELKKDEVEEDNDIELVDEEIIEA